MDLWHKFLDYLPRIPQSLVLLILGWVLAKIASSALSRALGRVKMDMLIRRFFARVIYITVFLLFGILALSQLGVNVSAFLVSLGAGGLIIGLALNSIIADFANGLMLFIHRPFQAGDYVKVAGVEGEIVEITIVNTHLLTPEGKMIYIPNRSVWGQTIVNYTPTHMRNMRLIATVPETLLDRFLRVVNEEAVNKNHVVKNSQIISITGTAAQIAVNIDLPEAGFETHVTVLMEALRRRLSTENLAVTALTMEK